jgi:HK97 gp10 family phage protein
MIGASFNLAGINAHLDRVAQAAKKNTRKAAQAGAQVYHDELKARVPVSAKPHKSGKKTYDPGTLRRAIYQAYVEEESGDSQATYRVSWNKSHAFYGKFLEYGTSKMAAKPFLRPTYDSARQRALSAVQAVMRSAVAEELRQ